MRITFVSPPFAGHFNPLLTLANAARYAGFEVDFITGPRKFATLREHGVTPVALRSIGPDTLESIANTGEPVGNNPFRLLAQFRENLRLLPAIGDELEELWKRDPPALVVADSVAPIAGLVCERLRIPWITTIATPFSIETRRGTPTYCGGWMPPQDAFERLRDARGRLSIRMFKRTVGLLFRREFAQLGLDSVYRADGTEAIYSPHAILGFGLRELEFDRDWPAQFQMIGPLIASPEYQKPLAIPEGRPRVLVTHGTHLLWVKKLLVDDVAALSLALPQIQFAVSLGEAGRALEPVEQRTGHVWIYPFLPYENYLGQFDAVIHHGGAGITYAAILAGVPSLVVPRDYDQFDYAARIVHHGLGLRVTSLAGQKATEALTRVLDRSQWPALANFQQHARAYQPERTFLETVRRLSHSL